MENIRQSWGLAPEFLTKAMLALPPFNRLPGQSAIHLDLNPISLSAYLLLSVLQRLFWIPHSNFPRVLKLAVVLVEDVSNSKGIVLNPALSKQGRHFLIDFSNCVRPFGHGSYTWMRLLMTFQIFEKQWPEVRWEGNRHKSNISYSVSACPILQISCTTSPGSLLIKPLFKRQISRGQWVHRRGHPLT